ncbi:MAG: indolepyruvate oxidoreductase subunit beta family protein [Rhodobacteraceae bacterium]|nr:indolepyruvate oxidoreductase subunit beta family protein [Paracoccaceae bacterium]
MSVALSPRAADPRLCGILKLAVMAVGGQGGGVLTDWIEEVARADGYAVQATSVAGVAQRTGATIYYVEMAPLGDRAPVFSLLPAAGDVDILIAAELMEAGRAILRGFVTPDRTTLIASTHRALAVSEKTLPGDGIANAEEVLAAAAIAAQRTIVFDMERIAVESGTVISASLFGALAGSGALPFPRAAFEAAIRGSGRGVEASLRAFARAYDAAQTDAAPPEAKPAKPAATAPRGTSKLVGQWAALTAAAQTLPAPVQAMALAGLRKVVDFQDIAYGREYLDRLATVQRADSAAQGWRLTQEAAKYIANAMAYDDVIRVADLKTRAPRLGRIRTEMGATDATLLQVTEFLHPRAEEIVGLLPSGLGARIEANPARMARIDRRFGKGRRLRSDSLWAFAQLYVLGGLRGWRRHTLRHKVEQQHLGAWLAAALAHMPDRYDLAVEVIRTRRLIKGYSDTHSRGLSKYDRVMAGITLVAARDDAADWACRLREAALMDEAGAALDGALMTIKSFA